MVTQFTTVNSPGYVRGPGALARRRARVGDYVRSIASGRIYLVDAVEVGWNNNVDVIGVTSVEDGTVNAFRPGEVEILSRTYIRQALGWQARTTGASPASAA